MPSIFGFVEKEGKFFAPVVYQTTRYMVENGVVVPDTANPLLRSGAKGVFAKVRFTTSNRSQTELFAVNTETFKSS